ncbi:MAG: hypothetical protein M0R17_06060 [Candidatus Omnitrophica bacterium]|jgi:hypothetical protein|nr:hypothetical protein [Candidatus Omnitrophota bacterium]
MNKGGQTIFFSIMLAVLLLLLAINLANPLKVVIDNARTQTNSTGGTETALNCSTATTYQEKANCTIVDIMLPLFILVLVGLAGFILTQI